MFERFTDGARRVLVLANEDAARLGHDFVGTEHLLLGLIREGRGLAAQALESLGVGLEAARREIDRRIPGGRPTNGSFPFTPQVKGAFEAALAESRRLDHDHVGTEHLLLGLLHDEEAGGAAVVAALVGDLGSVRRAVVALAESAAPGVSAGPTGRPTPVPGPAGPRCPSCRSLLKGRVAYRVLPVPAAEGQPGEAVDVRFVHCGHCGVAVPHTP